MVRMVRMVRVVRSLADRTFQLCDAPVGPARGEGERRGEHLRVRAREVLRGLRVGPRGINNFYCETLTKSTIEITRQSQTIFSKYKNMPT